jgi:BioD-like phosphotransacetylase family protein
LALIVVTSKLPGEGKTGVATAIARHYAYLGRPVRLVRALSSEEGANVAEDAAYYHSLAFAPGSPFGAVPAQEVAAPGSQDVVVVEADLAAAAAITGATVLLVARHAAPSAMPSGLSPAAVVVTDLAGIGKEPVAEAGSPFVVKLPEDRSLAGFSVEEARSALNAETLVVGDGHEPTCDYLVVAPIASDAGQPYFRRFDTKAVVVRFDKTDQHLAAMQANPACLILTGGRRPSDYLFDAASAKGIPVLLSRTDTENTVIALERIFDRTRFHGERKLERMATLLDGTGLYEALSV